MFKGSVRRKQLWVRKEVRREDKGTWGEWRGKKGQERGKRSREGKGK